MKTQRKQKLGGIIRLEKTLFLFQILGDICFGFMERSNKFCTDFLIKI